MSAICCSYLSFCSPTVRSLELEVFGPLGVALLVGAAPAPPAPRADGRALARRRAQRLSYAIWGVVGGQGVDLQALLDCQSTSDRLRLALLRMREVDSVADLGDVQSAQTYLHDSQQGRNPSNGD